MNNSITLSTQFLLYVIYAIILILTNYIIPEYQTIVLIIFILIFILFEQKIELDNFSYIKPLLIYMIVGLFGLFKYMNINFIRDVYYIMKPIICMTFGYYIMLNIKDYKKLFHIIIIVGLLFSTIRIIQFSYHYINGDIVNDLYYLRTLYGNGSIISVLSITLLHLLYKHKINLYSNVLMFTFSLINISAVLLSFSRTFQIATIISFIIINRYYRIISLKNIFKIIIFILFISFLLFSFGNYFENTIFYEKINKTIEELFVRNYNDITSINTFWRGYESFKGMHAYLTGSFLSIIGGKGFGYLLDVEFMQLVGDKKMRYIPFLHNGYVYILLKTGLIGLFSYLLFFKRLYSNSNIQITKINNINDFNICNDFLRIMVIQLLIVTFVISGIFNKEILPAFMIILGSMICCKKYYNKVSSNNDY